jgi:ribosome-associated protein
MGTFIEIAGTIGIDSSEIAESFVRASGPGGQNVNKVSTAVQIRFDLYGSPGLPEPVKARAGRIAGSKLTKDGVIVLTANRFRTQEQNRTDARERLVGILQKACEAPKPRRATRPTLASKLRRLDAKSKDSAVKKLRQARPGED